MRVLCRRGVCFVVLFIYMFFLLSNVNCSKFSEPYSKKRTSAFKFLGQHTNIMPGAFGRIPFQFEGDSSSSHISFGLNLFLVCKLAVTALSESRFPVIDKRKLIKKLLSRYLEGSKYKPLPYFT